MNMRAIRRKPHEEICGEYLHRYYLLPKNRFLNVYLHRFQEPDPGRDLHDHPWWSLSVVLKGRYVEQCCEAGGAVRTRTLGGLRRFALRRPTTRHTIIRVAPGGCWTIFMTGPKRREWGFHTREGWVHNQLYDTEQRPARATGYMQNQ